MNNKTNNNFSLRKLLLTALVAGPLATLPAPLWALPSTASTNLTTSSSSVVVATPSANTLNVTAPDKSVLTWVDFGGGASTIASGDVINYFLPATSSSVLNLVSGSTPTVINGLIASNGNVYVLNKNGITIGATGQINTGGFYATTIDEQLAAFGFGASGTLVFSGTATQPITVINGASLQALGTGNNIRLYGKGVDFQGGIAAGNLYVNSLGGAATFGTTNPAIVNTVGSPAAGGSLTVITAGGGATLTGAANAVPASAGTLTVAGNVSVDTTGTTNGTIGTGTAKFQANGSGTKVTLNAGTGTSAGNITIQATQMAALAFNGNNVSFNLTGLPNTVGPLSGMGGTDITVSTSTAAGTLTFANPGNGIAMASGATVAAAGNIQLSGGGSSTVSFTGTGNLTFAMLGTSSTTTISTSGNVDLSASLNQVGGTATQNSRNLTLTTTGGTITTGALSNNTRGTLTATGDITINGAVTNSGITITSSGGKITTAALTLTTTSTVQAVGDITLGAYALSNGGAVTFTSTGGKISGTTITQTAGSWSSTSSGDTTFSGALSTTSGGISMTSSAGTISTGAITSTTTSSVSLTAPGDIALAGGNIRNFSVTSTGGKITQTGAIISTSTATFNALNDITLTTGTNDFNRLVLINGGGGSGGITITNAGTGANNNAGILSLTGATNTKGAVSVTSAGPISIGLLATNAAGQNINGSDSLVFGNGLTITATGATVLNNKNNPNSNLGAGLDGVINTFANNVYVLGNVSLNTTNQNAVLGTPGLSNNSNYSFGAINAVVGTGTLMVNEGTTLNLGTITANALVAQSLNGDIVNSGTLKITTTAVVASGSIFSPGNVSLTNTSSTIGQVTVANANNFTGVVGGAGVAGVVVAGPTASVDGRGILGAANVTAVAGTTTLTLNTQNGGDYTTVGTNTSGATAVTINDPSGVTIQNATSTGTGTFTVNGVGTVTLGSGIALNSTGVTTINATGANALITDSAPNVSVVGPAVLNSDAAISITQANHSFGPISLISGKAGGAATASSNVSITYTEGGTANLNVVAVNQGAFAVNTPGSLKVVSTSGGIQQTPATGTISVPWVSGGTNTATFSSATGNGVNLSNPANTNSVLAPVTITASGNSSIVQGANVQLNGVTVGAGSFLADASNSGGTANTSVTEIGTSTMFVYGNSAFRVAGTGTINVSNSGNGFGAISILTGGGTASIKESGTLNLASIVTGAGAFTAVSETGGIIETSNPYSGAFVTGITVSGATSLTAQAAGITLNSGNSFGGGALTLITNGGGSVTVSDNFAGVTLLANGTNITGALRLNNTGAGGSIRDGGAGGINVTGNTIFDAGSGVISIAGAGNNFGALAFRGGQVTIAENNTMNLNVANISASGAVALSSNANITTTGTSGGYFAGPATSLTLSAGGNITISSGIFVSNGLTFRALGAVDLSALSLLGNLNGIAPTNLGASSYKPPTP